MMKPIKFDLKLNDGTPLRMLSDLQENLSPAVFEHFHTGKLAKWLRVRKLEDLAEKVEVLRAQNLKDQQELEARLFKSFCAIFASEVSEEDAREAMQHYKPIISEEKIAKFIVQNGIATDTETGLMWLRFSYGQNWENNTVMGQAKGITWMDAMDVPFNFNQTGYAGYKDWRIPDIKELETLIRKEEPENWIIDDDIFPRNGMDGNVFWSSSSYDIDNKRYVNFYYGSSDYAYKHFNYYVRLVRG